MVCSHANAHHFSSSLSFFKDGDDVEQLLVAATLVQRVECPVEVLQQFVEVFVGAFHGRQAAFVLTREGLVVWLESERL
jgi:hypothetical protein